MPMHAHKKASQNLFSPPLIILLQFSLPPHTNKHTDTHTPPQSSFSWEFLLGALMVVVCFVIVTVLDHFGSWDPLWALIKKAVTLAREYRLVHRIYHSIEYVCTDHWSMVRVLPSILSCFFIIVYWSFLYNYGWMCELGTLCA